MGKAALLAIAAFTIFGAYYALGSKQSILASQGKVSTRENQITARNAALTAFDRAKQQIVDNPNNTTDITNGVADHSTYAVDFSFLSGSTDRLKIVATGKSNGEEAKITAIALKEVQYQLPPEPPSYLQYALLVDDNLRLNGNVDVSVYADGFTANKLNANMHTNGVLDVDGNASSVRGFGTYVVNATGKLSTTFQPNYNPTNAPSTSKVSKINIPGFDINTFKNNVTIDSMGTGNVTLSGNVDFGGTRENPFVIYIPGNLTATGNTVVDGYVMFLVAGNIKFTGNTRVGQSGNKGADESSMAFYANGQVEFGGNTETYGQIYSNTRVWFHGGSRIYGSITSKGDAQFSGNPDIYYRVASPGLATNFEQTPSKTVWKLISYSE